MTQSRKPKSRWRFVRRFLIALAILATLVAVFYTEENWRGKHDWETCKTQLEAQGVVLDWDKFIPPPVPDDQNFYTTSSNILLRFRQIPDDDTNAAEAARQLKWLKLYPLLSNGIPVFPAFDTSKSGPIIVAKTIVSPDIEAHIPQDTNTFTVTLNDARVANQIGDRIRNILQTRIGRFTPGVQGFNFSEFQFTNNLPLLQIFVQALTPPTLEILNTFCPTDAVAGIARLQVVSTSDPNTFDILLTDMRITSAADYLKWSDQFVPAFDDVRQALKRPYAIIPGDYSQPYRMPIPNFVTLRALAQTLGQRAQCYLLLGEPDKALHELTLIHDVCRILEKPPTGKPETLVEAMINVAITGVYVQIVNEGLQLHQWKEPQLTALQQQLKETDLTPFVSNAFQALPADLCRNAEIVPMQQMKKWFSLDAQKTLWVSKLGFWLMPRGWVYQNMVQAAELQSKLLPVFDPPTDTISPRRMDSVMLETQKTLEHHSPFLLLAGMAIHNFSKAWQTAAYNQTMVNEAQIACALERYHLAHGEYPETLDALSPQFMETFPHDIIGGEPLIYRRTDDGKFLLYSIGWNEIDDGGEQKPHRGYPYTDDYTKGDWVWPN